MQTYNYKSYDHYVKCQKKANAQKNSNIWAVEKNIKAIADYIYPLIQKPGRGLCHGVRQGLEQKWFASYMPKVDVFGTEIGNVDSPNTTQWDFNKVNSEWVGQFDFIYSNSFDHAFNPEKTMKVWAKQLKPGGFIILEYDRRQEHTGEISRPVNKVDPVSIRFDEMKQLFLKWVPGSRVSAVLDMPVVTQQWRKALVFKVG